MTVLISKMAACQLRNRSRTLSATKLASSPSRAKFRDDSHWETYLEDEAVVATMSRFVTYFNAKKRNILYFNLKVRDYVL